MTEKIEAGDIVTLKSGGPKMTVAWVERNEAVCVWFDGTKQSERSFQLVVLKNANDNPVNNITPVVKTFLP